MLKSQEPMESIVEKQRDFFHTGKTRDLSFRLSMLRRLEAMLRSHEDQLLAALQEDLGKSAAEAYVTELGMVYGELRAAGKKLRAWSRPRRVRGTLSTFPSRNYIFQEPYGVVLILAPWNYPVNLVFSPLVGAIAAGNCAIVKCSGRSLCTSALIFRLLSETFDPAYLACADPGISHEEVLASRYDYIFFTGSSSAGKEVLQAASQNLTPVTLELGGKSPCIVDETADLKLAARRIAWGKFLNAGQTCISVDYVLVQRSVKAAFLQALVEEILLRYPNAENSPSYPKIINERHFGRLSHLLLAEKHVIGGERNEAQRKIAPALLPDADWDHEVMQEEIFGPLLPVITYEDLNDVIRTLRDKEKPLALYVFTKDTQTARQLIRNLSFGGGCVNDVILQITNHHLPFGGVGKSGMGQYHGKYSFETFSHPKGIVWSGNHPDLPFRYAPFDSDKLRLFRKFL